MAKTAKKSAPTKTAKTLKKSSASAAKSKTAAKRPAPAKAAKRPAPAKVAKSAKKSAPAANIKRAATAAGKTDFKRILWNLSELYANREDPRVDQDMRAMEKSSANLAKEYRGRIAELDTPGLIKLLNGLEEIDRIAYRLVVYANLEYSTKSTDETWGAFNQKIMESYAKSSADLAFVHVEWNALDAARAARVAADPALARYRHFLEHARLFKPHTLSEPEEVLARKLDPIGGAAWTRYYTSVLSDIRYEFRGKVITASELTAKLQDPDRQIRKEASEVRAKGLLANVKPLTFAFNMVLAGSKVRDELRSYGHWVQQRNLSNEIPDRVVDALVKAVFERVDIMQRYFTIKARAMKLRPLMSYDLWAPLPGARQPKADYGESVRLVTEMFQQTRPAFGKIARDMFAQSHVDAPPYKGKRAGAFCASNMQGLPYVLLNWTGKQRDVATMAHELGHAVHAELSRKQGPLGAVESLVMAEVASVFMETMLFERLLAESKNARERLALLQHIIEDGFATTYRQLQFNRFEDAVHNHRRDKGELSSDEIHAHFRRIELDFFGDTVRFPKDSDCFWMYISHFVAVPGYVYAYCASYLVVLALYRRYQEEGSPFLAGYEEMLAAGGSKSPEELLAELGVDWSDPSFWLGGLEVMRDYVDRFEATAQELGLLK